MTVGDRKFDGAGTVVEQISNDSLIDGRVKLLQPLKGYRAGSDAVLLAAAVAVTDGQRILDVGSGVGAVSLCLAYWHSQINIIGLEIQRNLVELARRNMELNDVSDRIEMLRGDIARAPVEIISQQFDHIVCNPPFYADGKATSSPKAEKAVAHGEGTTSLDDWVSFCVKRALPGGSITFIHRTERLPELLTGFSQAGAGDIRILPLWPAPVREAKRVIVQALAQRRGPARLLSGIAMHNDDGSDTEAARQLLRDGNRIDMENGGGVVLHHGCAGLINRPHQ